MQDEILLVKSVFEHIKFKKKEKRVKKLPTFFSKNLYALVDNMTLLKNDCSYSRLVMIHGNFLSILGNLYEIIKLIDYCLRRHYLPEKISVSFTNGFIMQQFLVCIVDTMICLKSSIPVPRASYECMYNVYKALEKFTTHGHCLKYQTEYQTYDIMLYLRHFKKNFDIVYDDAVMQIVRRYPTELLSEED
jgi:hypothetical protein